MIDILFPILFVLAFISGVWRMIIKKDLDKLMKRENSSYTRRYNSIIDEFRVIGTFRKSNTLSRKEKKLLIKVIILIAIGWFFTIPILLFIFFVSLNS